MNESTLDTADLDATKIRARRLRGAAQAARPVAEPAAEGDAPRRDTAQKLSKGQRAILIRLVAQLHYVDAVKEALGEDYPDFPQISDELIRYYRRQITAGETAEVQAARADALKTGLANKAVRVGHLIRQAEQLRRVPLIAVDPESRRIVGTRLDVARELRETMKQIAQELGQLTLSAPAVPGAAGDDLSASAAGDDLDVDEPTIRGDLEQLLRGIADRDRETEAALQAARRPAEVME